ncbi:hypothetical protein FO440_10105 [Mucilaginibacter corticis]|uniref:RNA polymerase sigma-70 region 2 domain-containing protein n=1 Tax=Mucilaginibacter corticis TaxID=2597670 RepID=A0A556MX60_9SPHI|nr:hypothetical protein [Mucilaginibacter corticis]TSJ44506.1 hypothetical protein FO440_10105 [Mucilaginibacter corticis]
MASILLSNDNLLKAIRAKSRVGAEALYDQYAKVLSLAIFRIVRDRELTDTLLEETFHQIWDDAVQYNEHETPLLAWMLGIAKNLALQQTTVIKTETTESVILEFKLA